MPTSASIKVPASAGSLTLASYVSFVPIGIATVLLGPMLPVLSERWSMNYSQAGALFAVQYVSSTVAVALSGVLVSRYGFRFPIKTGLLLMAAGLALLMTGPKQLALICIGAYGAGLGLAVPAGNLLVAELNPDRRSAALSWLNFYWSAGAVTCPFLVAYAAKVRQVPLLLACVSGFSLLVALAFAVLPAPIFELAKTPGEGKTAVPAIQRKLNMFFILAALFFLYVGTENAFGGWVASFAKGLGNLTPVMALVTPSFLRGVDFRPMAGPVPAPKCERDTVGADWIGDGLLRNSWADVRSRTSRGRGERVCSRTRTLLRLSDHDRGPVPRIRFKFILHRVDHVRVVEYRGWFISLDCGSLIQPLQHSQSGIIRSAARMCCHVGTLFQGLAALLLHEHAIAVRIEAVASGNGMTVGIKDVFLAAQSADKHKKRRFRQVKIRQKSLDDLEVVPGIDEKVRLAAARMDLAGMLLRGELERTHRGRANRDYTSGLAPGFPNFRSGLGGDRILFGMQLMVFDPLNSHRLEGSEAHVQCNFGGFNATRGQAGQNLSREMKACGGRGDRSPVASIHGLITFVVGRRIGARDVRR